MGPIVVHYIPNPEFGSESIDGLIRKSGGVPLRTWVADDCVYAVIAEPNMTTIDVLADVVEVLAAAKLDLVGDPSEQIGLLPDSLPRRIEFPPESKSEPQAAIIGPGKPLVHCHCNLGIHPAPRCDAGAGTSSDERAVS